MQRVKSLLFSIKERVLKSEFNKNVIILSGGTIIAQAIPVLISPILTRLYSPSDFGVLALFVSITSIVGVIANGRYELAIMLPEKDEDAINVAAVGFLFNIAISLLFLILVILFKNPILKLFKAESLSFWIYLTPLTVFFIGLFNILNYTNNRFKLYKDISKSNILKSIAGASVQLVFGLIKDGTSGLIFGQMASQIVANTKLFSNIRKTRLLKEIKKDKINEMAKNYVNFPKYSLWAGLLNTLSIQITPLLLGKYFLNEVVGQFYLSNRILYLPMSILGSSFAQVFFKEASLYKSDKNKLSLLVYNMQNKLFKISFLPFSFIFVFGEIIFGLFFGIKWKDAGLYSQILSPWIFLVFIYSPISGILDILGKQKISFFIQIIFLITRILSIMPGAIIFKNSTYTLIIYSIIGYLLIISILVYINYLLNIKILNLVKFQLKFFIFCMVLFLFKILLKRFVNL